MRDQKPDNVRTAVEKAYAEAITASTTSCCGPSCCSPSPTAIANQVGYSKADIDLIALDMAPTSFGCGNPLAFADIQPGETVVDLGSGAGLDLLLAAKAVGPEGRVIGIDMTDAMIDTARANIAKAGATNVEVRKGIIEAMPVDSASANWVISNCVINLSPEKERVFAEIARVLKPGGTMQVSDIVVQDLPDWARASQDLFTSCVGGAISEEQYLQGLRDAGLTDVEVVERVIYSADQIKCFVDGNEVPIAATVTPDEVEAIAASLEGKVWSAKIRACKPEPKA